MTENLPKYVFADTTTVDLDKYVKLGYKVHTIDFAFGTALMSLSSAKYEGITNLKDVQPSEVDGHLADGWIVADSYSKFIRMVKPSAEV